MAEATKKNKNSVLNMLSFMAMGIGQGMTGQPFLSNYVATEEEKRKNELAMQQWMAEQELKKQQQQIEMAKLNMFPSPRPISKVPPNMYQEVGSQGYRYSPRPVVMPDLSKLGLGQGTGITGASVDTSTGKTTLNIGQTPGSKVNQEVAAEAGKKAAGSERDFLIAKGKLRTTMGAFKAMAEESGGTGRVAGVKNVLGGLTGKNPYVQAFRGQLVEAAASLAKLAAPSARVGQEIIEQFKKTLPTEFNTMAEATNQIRFSMHNAFATALGQSGKEYTQEMRNQVDGFVKDIVDTPALTLKDFGKDSSLPYFRTEAEAESAGLPVGSFVFINGRKYKVK